MSMMISSLAGGNARGVVSFRAPRVQVLVFWISIYYLRQVKKISSLLCEDRFSLSARFVNFFSQCCIRGVCGLEGGMGVREWESMIWGGERRDGAFETCLPVGRGC